MYMVLWFGRYTRTWTLDVFKSSYECGNPAASVTWERTEARDAVRMSRRMARKARHTLVYACHSQERPLYEPDVT